MYVTWSTKLWKWYTDQACKVSDAVYYDCIFVCAVWWVIVVYEGDHYKS